MYISKKVLSYPKNEAPTFLHRTLHFFVHYSEQINVNKKGFDINICCYYNEETFTC